MFFIYAVVYALYLKISAGKFWLYFVYMTNLNLTGTAITMTFGAILVTLFHYEKMELQKRMIKRMKIYWWLWNQTLVLSWIVSIFFWMDFIKQRKNISEIEYNDFLTHVFNCILPTLDLFIVKHPPNYANGLLHVGFVFFYGLFTFVFQVCGGKNA